MHNFGEQEYPDISDIYFLISLGKHILSIFMDVLLMSTHNICFCITNFVLVSSVGIKRVVCIVDTRRGASNEYPQHIFLWRNKNIYIRFC